MVGTREFQAARSAAKNERAASYLTVIYNIFSVTFYVRYVLCNVFTLSEAKDGVGWWGGWRGSSKARSAAGRARRRSASINIKIYYLSILSMCNSFSNTFYLTTL